MICLYKETLEQPCSHEDHRTLWINGTFIRLECQIDEIVS